MNAQRKKLLRSVLSLVLCLSLLVCAPVTLSAAEEEPQVTLTVGTVAACPGDTVEIPVRVDGLASVLSLTPVLDAGLELVSVKNGDSFDSLITGLNLVFDRNPYTTYPPDALLVTLVVRVAANAPEGKHAVRLEVNEAAGYDEILQDDIYLSARSVPGGVAVTDEPDVIFGTNSLVLSGEIGVNFFLTIRERAQTSDAYMEFRVSGKGNKVTRVPLSAAEKLSDGRFKFTCYITSLQMAETITATYHYGDVIAVGQSSAKAYIDRAKAANYGGDAKLETLLKSVANLGYYTQMALSAANGFTVGESGADYKTMDHYSTPDLNVNLDAFAYSETGSAAGITKVSRSLGLDAETSIYLYFSVASGRTDAPAVTVKNKNGAAVAVTVSKQSDGRYKLTIPNIPAHKLGDEFTITVDGTLTIRMSAMSYVNIVLNAAGADAATKNMVASLYEYYRANMNYRDGK